MNMLAGWLIYGLSVFIAAHIIPGVEVKDLSTALIVAIALGIINTFIKPILTILTLPITIITLGLFSLVLNALLILLVSNVVQGFHVSGLLSALLFGLALSIVNSLLNMIVW